MSSLSGVSIKIFADGAEKRGILELYSNPLIKGLTTNPTLMRKAGIADYEAFAREILETVTGKPISFEVFSDDFSEMHRQALKINNWQENVYVKIPITNTKRESSAPLIQELVKEGVKVNVTAILDTAQVRDIAAMLAKDVPSVISVFAGRIADTGRDPIPEMREALRILEGFPSAELLWASCREVLNIRHAADAGAHIVTVPHDILAKALNLWSQNLSEVSLDTVKMFYRDALAAGYSI
jgi:transaldolase